MTSPQKSASSLVSGKDVYDGLHNYDIHEELGQGATSVVHRAICKRGRLRNRQVALKKIMSIPSDSQTEVAHLASSTSLYQKLHHPSIVSLLSTFFTSSGHYHVLELCSGGTLASFLHSRHPPILSEHELRGVARSLADALIYLKSEHIIHRDIKPSNILLTEDFRIKLSDFGLATRLPRSNSTTSTFCGSPNYVAPEIISRLPYGASVDIWSLGCLMVTCLLGIPVFEAPSVDDIFANIIRGKYTLPDTISFEAKDIISGLLQTDPANRIPLHRILSHPFFNPALPVKPLTPPQIGLPRPISAKLQKENAWTAKPSTNRYPQSLSKGSPNKRQPSNIRSSSGPASITTLRRPLVPAENRDLRNILRDELSQPMASEVKLSRRVVSVPSSTLAHTVKLAGHQDRAPLFKMQSVPPTPALTADSGSIRSGTAYALGDCARSEVDKRDSLLVRHPLLSIPGCFDSDSGGLYARDRLLPAQTQTRAGSIASAASSTNASVMTGVPQEQVYAAAGRRPFQEVGNRRCQRSPSPPVSAIAVGSVRPSVFSTANLGAKTHKVTQGQVVVLPSRSLLIDCREGERRRGRKGTEVLLVSSEGQTIQIYSAPHLSTPCCLAEPLATYSLVDLPARYWKLYSDAGRVVDRLKQRIPKLVLQKPDFKCTLMANEPHGDIELVFTSTDLCNQGRECRDDVPANRDPSMRIRMSRVRQSVEIARYIPPVSDVRPGTGEWVKKVFPTSRNGVVVSQETLDTLEPEERIGLRYLTDFLRVCEAVEALEESAFDQDKDDLLQAPRLVAEVHKTYKNVEDGQSNRRRLEEVLCRLENQGTLLQPLTADRRVTAKRDDDGETLLTVATTATTNVLRSVDLPPRPSKFSSVLPRYSDGKQVALDSDVGSGYILGTEYERRTPPSFQTLDENGPDDTPQTRFIPSVGWCIRYGRGDARRYRLMFQDGAALEVDVGLTGQEAVQYNSSNPNELPMHMSREAADKRIPERMKALERCIELFP